MTDLIERLAAAKEGDERLLIREAIKTARDNKWIDQNTAIEAGHLLAAGARLDAALILVPDGWDWFIDYLYRDHLPGPLITVRLRNCRTGIQYAPDEGSDNAPTPALALVIASLRAREDK